jgi:signal peptidase II
MAVESRPPAPSGAANRPSPGARPLPGHVRPDGWRPAALEWAGLAAVAVAALAADQLTKTAVDRSLALGGIVHLAPGLSLWHVQNQGVAFGAFAGRLPVVVLLTAAAVSWMVVYFARSGARHPLLPVAIGLLLGGSLSNLWDRIVHGYVTDFVYVHHWPTFNLADSFIVVGVGLLLWVLLRGEARPAGPAIDITNR